MFHPFVSLPPGRLNTFPAYSVKKPTCLFLGVYSSPQLFHCGACLVHCVMTQFYRSKDITNSIKVPVLKKDNWIGLSSVLRPRQHSIGYIGDGFYRSKNPTNSIKVLKENLQNTNQTTETTQNTDIDIRVITF